LRQAANSNANADARQSEGRGRVIKGDALVASSNARVVSEWCVCERTEMERERRREMEMDRDGERTVVVSSE
jgi:hypothetical protein